MRRVSLQCPEYGLPLEGLAELPANAFGMITRHGVAPGKHGATFEKTNQDRGMLTHPWSGSLERALLSVFDGHGPHGDQVAEFVMLELHNFMVRNLNRLKKGDIHQTLTDAFEHTDEKLRHASTESQISGTTGLMVLVDSGNIYVANTGDSRAVIGRRSDVTQIKAIQLTVDHKPNLPAEKARILAAGGYVSPRSQKYGPSRVWVRIGQGAGLAMSRSLGDHVCARVGVIATPEIATHMIAEEDMFIVIATDGVWEVLSNEEVVEILAAHGNINHGCTTIVEEATRRWAKQENCYRDDITAIGLQLPLPQDPPNVEFSDTEKADLPRVMFNHLLAQPNFSDLDADQVAPEEFEELTFKNRRLTVCGELDEEAVMELTALECAADLPDQIIAQQCRTTVDSN